MRSKRRVFFLAFVTAVAAGLLAPARPARASASVSVSFFYDSLAPYGDWVTVPAYGRCWRPAHVAVGWQPYLDGEWDYTDAGWTWVSFDPWGGDPYHYGTWVFTARFGWVWIPGTVWAPAWVTWCITDDAYGWAPVPPSFAVGIGGYFGPAVTVSRRAYVFVPARQFAGVRVNTIRLPEDRNATFLARSRLVTRFSVRGGMLTAGGPALSRVEHASGRRIARVSLSQARTRAVPIRSSLEGRRSRATVVVPTHERAKLIAPHERHAPANVSRTRAETHRSRTRAETHSAGHAVRFEPRPRAHEQRGHAGQLSPRPPAVGTRGQAVHAPPLPRKVERHERTARSPGPAHVTPRGETSGALVRSERGRQERSNARHNRSAPAAHVMRPPNARPKPPGPPPAAHGKPPGRERHPHPGRED